MGYARHWLSLDAPKSRTRQARDHLHLVQDDMILGNAVGFTGVQYYSQPWRTAKEPGSADYIDAEWNFKVGAGGTCVCHFINDLIDALGVIRAEFAVEGVELGSAIDAVCKEVYGPSVRALLLRARATPALEAREPGSIHALRDWRQLYIPWGCIYDNEEQSEVIGKSE